MRAPQGSETPCVAIRSLAPRRGLRARLLATGFLSLLGWFAVVAPSPAHAYVSISIDPWTPAAWRVDTVPVYLDQRLYPFLTAEEVEGALQEAIQAWMAVDCATISLSFEGYLEASAEQGIYIVWPSTSEEGPAALSGEAAAITETYIDGSGRIFRADMFLNAFNYSWTVSDGPLSPEAVDLQAVLTHELGHAIGLGHSRDRLATMFFSGGSASLRTLEPDDASASCFLYPTGEAAVAVADDCDTCTADGNCTNGGRCVRYPDSFAFCATPCGGDADCPGGFSCTEVEDAGRVCLANNEFCTEEGAAIPLGEYCYGAATCASEFCNVTPRGAHCSQFCDTTDDGSCPEGFACIGGVGEICGPDTPTGACGVCTSRGDGGVGDPCWDPTDCTSALCFPGVVGASGRCTATCSADAECPVDSVCRFGICVVPGEKPSGAPCASPFECGGAHCLAVHPIEDELGNPGLEVGCTDRCDTSTDCPFNSFCQNVVAQEVCQSDSDCGGGGCEPGLNACACSSDTQCSEGEVCEQAEFITETGDSLVISLCQLRLCVLEAKSGMEGNVCNENRSCLPSYHCVAAAADYSACRTKCEPGGASAAECSEGQLCRWLDTGGVEVESPGFCIASQPGVASDGQDCSDAPCAADHGCIETPDGAQRCRRDCQPDNGSACADGFSCQAVNDPRFFARGACLPEGDGEPVALEVAPLFEPFVVEEPPEIDTGEPGGATINGSVYALLSNVRRGGGGGCSAAVSTPSSGGVPPGGLALFLLGLVAYRIRRECRDRK